MLRHPSHGSAVLTISSCGQAVAHGTERSPKFCNLVVPLRSPQDLARDSSGTCNSATVTLPSQNSSSPNDLRDLQKNPLSARNLQPGTFVVWTQFILGNFSCTASHLRAKKIRIHPNR